MLSDQFIVFIIYKVNLNKIDYLFFALLVNKCQNIPTIIPKKTNL